MSDVKLISGTNKKDWRLLEFFVPISEKVVTESNEFMIRGVAINETTTLNGVKYVAEELEKAAASFRGVPILLDHKNEVKNIVGRTTENVHWSPTNKRIEFEAKIMDKDIKERIQDGRIGSVSIGARVQDLVEEDGVEKAIGIQGLEISLVAVPGDSQATLAQALQECKVLKEKAQLNKLEEKQMVETDTKDVSQTPAEEEKPVEKPAEEPAVEDKPAEEPKSEEPKEVATEKVDNKLLSEMKSQLAELKVLLKEKRKIMEQTEEEKPEVKPEVQSEDKPVEDKMEDQTKGEVSDTKEEALEKVNNRIVEAMGGTKFALYRDYNSESADSSNLKRLVR